MSIREQVVKELSALSEAEIQQVADYLAFLKFRARVNPTSQLAEEQLAALYAEFAEEDRELAEQGIADYAKQLTTEDAR